MESFSMSEVEYPGELGSSPRALMSETEKLKEIQGY